jgi:hypothetical protein
MVRGRSHTSQGTLPSATGAHPACWHGPLPGASRTPEIKPRAPQRSYKGARATRRPHHGSSLLFPPVHLPAANAATRLGLVAPAGRNQCNVP